MNMNEAERIVKIYVLKELLENLSLANQSLLMLHKLEPQIRLLEPQVKTYFEGISSLMDGVLDLAFVVDIFDPTELTEIRELLDRANIQIATLGFEAL